MTTQIKDRIVFAGHEYSILECDGGRLVCPADFGMKATSTMTANHRGFCATYEVTDTGWLQLHRFELRIH